MSTAFIDSAENAVAIVDEIKVSKGVNKTYTFAELKELMGEEFISKFGKGIPRVINKKIIEKYSDFDKDTKAIYKGIYDLIKAKNPNQDFELYATGSRIKGYWRTIEEADALALQYGFKAKYSDYDCTTNAINKPTKEDYLKALNVAVDYAGSEAEKILITPYKK
tara:strand:+ start:1480 stop:1974 length:495 start_codon:yes stop_codon:yes gene_type:complete